jgi:hypothetical protein
MAAPPPSSGLTASPTWLNFGRVVVLSDYEWKSVALTNNTGVEVSYSSQSTDPEFAYANLCTTMGTGQSCTMSVGYRPTTVGRDRRTYSLTFASSSTTYTVNFAVSGTGYLPKGGF